MMKPLIIDKERFNQKIFDSILTTISKKYVVEINDLYTLKEITNLIITDIIQTPFLNHEQKDSYCSVIIALQELDESSDVKFIENGLETNLENKNNRYGVSTKYFSFVLGLTTSIFGIVAAFMITNLMGEIDSVVKLDFPTSSIIGLVLIPLFSITVVNILQNFIKYKKNKKTLIEMNKRLEKIIRKPK